MFVLAVVQIGTYVDDSGIKCQEVVMLEIRSLTFK